MKEQIAKAQGTRKNPNDEPAGSDFWFRHSDFYRHRFFRAFAAVFG